MHQHRTRLPLLAALTSGVLAAGCLALLPATTTSATAAPAPGPAAGAAAGTRQADFTSAAAEFHVPASVLLALAYEESRWDAHPGRFSTGGGYGPMNLTDVTAKMAGAGGAGAAGRGDIASFTEDPALHTLTTAARLTGASPAALRTDSGANIRGGTALLASYEKTLTGGTPAGPAQWYGAVARYSRAVDRATAGAFAARVYATLRTGASRTADQGQRVAFAGDPALRPSAAQLVRAYPKAPAQPGPSARATECPATVSCRFVAASPSNGQVADRPDDGMSVKYLVIHDTETSYDAAVRLFQTAGGASAHYVMKSSDGSVTQMVPTKDLAFHAGNYWFNMHSIGIEHEGYAAQGATWYTEAQYQETADLVTYLAAKYGIPLDREHIIGHDNVPAPTDGTVAGMHWDPGPYWDWNRFMALLGVPAPSSHGVGAVGTAVTITPSFAANVQTAKICPADDPSGATPACTSRRAPSNFLPVRTAPDPGAPVVADPYVHAGGEGTTGIADWGGTVSAGQQYVVAGTSGNWTAIWYAGKKGWILNSGGANTTPAPGARIVGAKGTGPASVPVYGAAYPDPSAYPAGLTPSTMAPLSRYTIPEGQGYVATGPAAGADDYFASSATVVTGARKFWTIQFNHRVALVDMAAVNSSLSN
ncbi:N-acetylmuramoyl-L-alanine amidase [Streptomyces sp. NBC_01497]|uniref:N-acetylmuramoyl-L-alanine amidase n=1 Tax=Streptomyces sp. NBC_01497 TaxID=2903885 RepID=UPI002E31F912|nr:N-acetylmuramoyl-L-alanine amidase [Streptomyces sp. NBC_01497]